MAGRTWDDFTTADPKLRAAAEAYCRAIGQNPYRDVSWRAASPVNGMPEWRDVPLWRTMLPNLRAAIQAYNSSP